MNATLVKFIAGVAVCASCASATAGSDPRCFDVKTDRDGVEVSSTRKRIHIDVKRPDRGVVDQATTYDASASTTPSGSIIFKWSEGSGGLKYSSFDQPVIEVTTDDSPNGVNAFTKLAVSDPVCGLSEQIQFNVNYYPQ